MIILKTSKPTDLSVSQIYLLLSFIFIFLPSNYDEISQNLPFTHFFSFFPPVPLVVIISESTVLQFMLFCSLCFSAPYAFLLLMLSCSLCFSAPNAFVLFMLSCSLCFSAFHPNYYPNLDFLLIWIFILIFYLDVKGL